MIINQATLSAIYQSFNTLFAKGLAGVSPLYNQLATVIPSTGALNIYPTWDKLPGMREWLGDRHVRNLTSQDFQIRNKDFEATIAVPRNDIEDDNIGVWNPMIQAFGAQAALHADILMMDLIANAFVTTKYTAYDGKAMCADDHVLGTRTFDNKGTPALSHSSFATAYAKLWSAFTDEDQIVSMPTEFHLLVAPSNYATAAEICQAGIILGDGTAGGSKENVWKGMAVPHVLPLLEKTPNYWFLVGKVGGLSPIIVQKRKEPKFVSFTAEKDENVFMRKEFIYGVDDRKNVGWGPFTLIYGSNGTT